MRATKAKELRRQAEAMTVGAPAKSEQKSRKTFAHASGTTRAVYQKLKQQK